MTKLTRVLTLLLAIFALTSFAACSGTQTKDSSAEQMKAGKKSLNKNTGKNMERAEEDE